MPRTQNFFTAFHCRRAKVIHRRLRGAFPGSPHRRMNNFGNRIRQECPNATRPGGTAENGLAFQRWVWTFEGLSPKGTADSAPIQPSLRGLKPQNLFPSVETSVETLGYSHLSLRDEQDQILVALDRKVCA